MRNTYLVVTMDEYPAFSLDCSNPLLAVLGLRANATQERSFDPGLKEQAVLLRSEQPLLYSDQAAALLHCLERRDVSDAPWNARAAAARKYSFRVRSTGRVGWRTSSSPLRELAQVQGS